MVPAWDETIGQIDDHNHEDKKRINLNKPLK